MSNQENTTSKNDTACCCCGCKNFFPSEETLAFWVLRVWIGLRALITGLEKFKYAKTVYGEENEYGESEILDKYLTYGFSEYHGFPGGLDGKMGTTLAAQPLMPKFGLIFFDATLGYILILLGVALLIGLGTRISLFLQGMIYSMLTVGLIMMGEDAGIAWLGVHIILIAIALVFAKHNKIAILKNF